jgi:hypothetical protein
MKAQKPAEGILSRHDFGCAKTYEVPCTCGCGEGTHKVWVEADNYGNITVTTYQQLKSKWWQLNRFQKIWTLLTKGYVESEACIIMTEQQALNYSATLESAVNDVREFRRKEQTKRKPLSEAMPDVAG